MIDKDCVVTRSLMHDWVRMAIAACKTYGVTVQSVITNPSLRKGFHIRLAITPPIYAELAWRLQFLLGDDAKRCSLNRARMNAGFDEWNKLFEGIRPRLTRIYIRRNPSVRHFDRKVT
jgi:hypothetical protein